MVGLLAPPTSFNPHLARDPVDGSFALYFRVNAIDAQPICVGNSSGPTTRLGAPLIKRCVGPSTTNCIHAGGSETGTNMYFASAPRMTGPWKVQPVGVQGEGKLHVSNPSVCFLRAGTPASKHGKVAMAFRYNSHHGETNGVAYATGPEGPFVAVANLTCHGCECVSPPRMAPFSSSACILHHRCFWHSLLLLAAPPPLCLFSTCRDPYIWQQPDGSMHMLYHNGPSSFHAFSADGISWTERDDAPMFTTTVASSDSGGKLQLKRRERPELVFAPKSGAPLLLLNGASADDPEGTYRAFSLVQHVGNNSSRHDNDVRRS